MIMIIIITFAGWCQCWRCQCLPLHREHAPQHRSIWMILVLFLEIDQFWSLRIYILTFGFPRQICPSYTLHRTSWGWDQTWPQKLGLSGAPYLPEDGEPLKGRNIKLIIRKWKLIIRKWKWIIKITMVLSIQAGLPSLMKGTKCPMAATVKFFLCAGLEQEDRTLLIVELIDSWRKIISNH